MSQYILPALFPKRPDNESHDILSSLVTEKGDFFWYSYNEVVHVRPFLVGYSVHFPLGACLFYMMYGWDLYDLFSDDWLYFLPFVSSRPSSQHPTCLYIIKISTSFIPIFLPYWLCIMSKWMSLLQLCLMEFVDLHNWVFAWPEYPPGQSPPHLHEQEPKGSM